jgi:uncharacterized sporulation protein YeaH/YhbH (DUF444 family)
LAAVVAAVADRAASTTVVEAHESFNYALFDRDDLRYLSYREEPRPRHRAVVFCVMDISASMTTDRKRMARENARYGITANAERTLAIGWR